MYAVIRRYEGVDKDTSNAVAARSHAGFRTRISERPGFVAYELIIGDDSIASISIFETWVVAEETNRVARQWIGDNLADFNLPIPQVTAGEIYTEPGMPPPLAPARRVKVPRSLENAGEGDYL